MKSVRVAQKTICSGFSRSSLRLQFEVRHPVERHFFADVNFGARVPTLSPLTRLASRRLLFANVFGPALGRYSARAIDRLLFANVTGLFHHS